LQVRHSSLHPLGIGIFKLRISYPRDNLVAHNPHFIGLRRVCFYPHDKVHINFRRAAFTKVSWIMLFAYPLDLKGSAIIPQVCAPFAKVLHWNSEDNSLAHILLKVLIDDPLEVPRSLIIKMGKESDGDGRSWTVPVFMFNSTLINGGPIDEDDPSANNGNPHLAQG
jgi:hypothetical protein